MEDRQEQQKQEQKQSLVGNVPGAINLARGLSRKGLGKKIALQGGRVAAGLSANPYFWLVVLIIIVVVSLAIFTGLIVGGAIPGAPGATSPQPTTNPSPTAFPPTLTPAP